MCGICGVASADSSQRNEAVVRRMLSHMAHRGPDDEGLVVRPGVVVGMRRLSIIDLPGGGQPIWNENRTLALILNGEIYNFRELREELRAKGHVFRTLSDTETVVHAYEQWGKDCVPHLRGMFAFALLELPLGEAGPSMKIFLARDRLGIKPLYFSNGKRRFVFASEVRAILSSGLVEPRLSSPGTASYLLFGSVVEPSTLLENVFSLPPSSHMTIDVSSGDFAPVAETYWRPPSQRPHPAAESTLRQPPPALWIRTLLEDAVRVHLVADVPLGIFLSSGIDSTALAALASRERKGLHTFTVVFPQREFSEADLARRTAQQLGTEHQELALSGEEMLSRLDAAAGALDQPSMDGINTYFVSWAARQAGLKVALSGLGSDEIFGGYATFRATRHVARIASLARALPPSIRPALAFLVRSVAGTVLETDGARKFSSVCRGPEAFPHPYFFTRLLFPPDALAAGGSRPHDESGSLAWQIWLARVAREADLMDPFTAVSWLELRSYLLQTLLRDTDAMSMHHSLEVRVPFLDHILVESVLALPAHVKSLAARPKALLVHALRDVLPAEVVNQPKRTFTLPWQNWLGGPLRQQVGEGLAEWASEVEPIFSRQAAQKVWQDFQNGRASWSRPWALYTLNEWVKRNLRATRSREDLGRDTAAVRAR